MFITPAQMRFAKAFWHNGSVLRGNPTADDSSRTGTFETRLGKAESMATKKPDGDEKVLTLKVALMDSAPEIWRRLEVLSSMTLGDLHYAIQITMGWTNDHLHEFHIGPSIYGPPSPDAALFGRIVIDEDTVTVGQLLKRKGSKLEYVYDFGDNWEHQVRVEGTAAPEPGVYYPRCIAGEMQCPPEDCGGPYGYYQMLEIIGDPEHDQYEQMREWLQDDFDPEAFDRDAVNTEIHRIKKWSQ
jgi:hypothetical protein